MKKIWIVCIAAIVLLSAVCIIFGSVAYTEHQQAIDIIGGADGPTAMLVAGETAKVLIPVWLVGAMLIIGLAVVISKKTKS